MLRKIVRGLVVAALFASPALAQSYNPSVGSGNLVPPITYGPDGQSAQSGASDAYAYEPAPQPTPRARHHMVRPRSQEQR